jgi:hypothetical protein
MGRELLRTLGKELTEGEVVIPEEAAPRKARKPGKI